MKNTLKEIGGYLIKEPSLVLKLCLVLDSYKLSKLDRLWKESEKSAPEKLPTFKKEDLFFQEQIIDGKNPKIIYSTRFYTPESNRELISDRRH